MEREWYVLETLCYPAKWKVTFDWMGEEHGDNDSSNYYRDRENAQREADRRNAAEVSK